MNNVKPKKKFSERWATQLIKQWETITASMYANLQDKFVKQEDVTNYVTRDELDFNVTNIIDMISAHMIATKVKHKAMAKALANQDALHENINRLSDAILVAHDALEKPVKEKKTKKTAKSKAVKPKSSKK